MWQLGSRGGASKRTSIGVLIAWCLGRCGRFIRLVSPVFFQRDMEGMLLDTNVGTHWWSNKNYGEITMLLTRGYIVGIFVVSNVGRQSGNDIEKYRIPINFH